MMKRILLVNLFGAPGAGKTTTAAYIFSRLKMAGIRAELLTEPSIIEAYPVSTSKKIEESLSLLSKTDLTVVITDCPAQLFDFYNNNRCPKIKVPDNFYTYNIFLERNLKHIYDESCRWHTEKESAEIEEQLKSLFKYDVKMQCSLNNNMNLYFRISYALGYRPEEFDD